MVLVVAVRGQEPPTFAEIAVKSEATKGKNPVILIPGILGSELVNKVSGEKVWFSVRRSKDDDLKLPISTSLARSRDNLVPGDILRSIKFLFASQDFYGDFAQVLQKSGGYTEESIDDPTGSLRDKFFVFPYDWRRDNVETARILVQKLDALKRKTGEKDIKFKIVAHSMGGLIARYAAMYGNRDLTSARPKPNWAGARLIDEIYLFGTPNHGAADSFLTLLEGYGAIDGVNLPFVRDMNAAEVFTMPSLFQLLPHSENQVFYDEDLKPLKVDLFDYRTWEKYGWSIYGDPDLFKKNSEAGVARLETYLEQVLQRASRFHAALDAGKGGPVNIVAFGSDCTDTLSGYVLIKEKGNWKAVSKPTAFLKSNGEKADITEVRTTLMKSGDGRVAKDSLESGLPETSKRHFACEKHDSLLANPVFQRQLLADLLDIKPAVK